MHQIVGKKYRFTVINERLLRLEYAPSGEFVDEQTQVVLDRTPQPNMQIQVQESATKLEVSTPFFQLYYDKKEFSPEGLFIDLKSNYSAYGNRWYYGETYATLKGTACTLDQIDGACELEEGLISQHGFAILDDSLSCLLDETGKPYPRKAGNQDFYFFAYGRDYYGAIRDFYKLSGRTPLLPRYALGNWWSRYWQYSEDEYLQLMAKFQEQKIPLSVSVLDMDWHLTEVPAKYGSGWTGYTWNRQLFPQPQAFLQKLHQAGLAVTLNVHPADGIRAFEDCYPQVAKALELNVQQEEPAIFDLYDDDFRKAYFEAVHHPLEAEGVDFWWIDWQQGGVSGVDHLDPLWLLNHYHYRDLQRKQKNDIILSRYAGPGSHRYPIGFSGDTIISWASLDFQPYFTATAANIGYSWWSHDIGGHMQGQRDDELALRWVQYGVFSPINRLHSSASHFTGKEPWRYNLAAQQSMTKFLQFRHQLIPYLYTMNVRTHEAGVPLVVPMYYPYPFAEEAFQAANQYLFGSEMLVAPITQKGDEILKYGKSNVWFPEGDWYDFFMGFRYSGGTRLDVYRDEQSLPVFVKAGGIVPLDANPNATVGTSLPENIQWHLFPGADHEFSLVEHSEDGKKVTTTLRIAKDQGEIQIEVSGDASILPAQRQHTLIFRSSEPVSTGQGQAFVEVQPDWADSYVVSLGAITGERVLSIENFAPVKFQNTQDELFKRLDKAEIAYVLKDKLWRKITSTTETAVLIAELSNLSNRELAKSLLEMYYIVM